MAFSKEEDASYAILLIADFTSIIGCTLVLLGFWRLKLLRNHITKIITFFCSTSLAKDLISTILTLQERKQSNGNFTCYLYATVITYGSLACWLWTLCLSFSIFNLIVKREPEPEKFEKYYHCVCWIIPFINTVIMLSKNVVQVTGNWCWIGEPYINYRFGLFYGWFLAIWFIATVLVGLTSRYTYKVIRSSVSDNKDKHMTYQFKLINYIIVFLICWIFGVINRIINGLGMYPTWVNILHTYLSVSHGFFASVTFIYNNPLMWRYLVSIILIPFTKLGYFVDTQHRLEKNKNNNNHSPVAQSNAAGGLHNGGGINGGECSDYNTSVIDSFSLHNDSSKMVGLNPPIPGNASAVADGANKLNGDENGNKEIEPIDNNNGCIELNYIQPQTPSQSQEGLIPPQQAQQQSSPSTSFSPKLPPLPHQPSLQDIDLNDNDDDDNSNNNNSNININKNQNSNV